MKNKTTAELPVAAHRLVNDLSSSPGAVSTADHAAATAAARAGLVDVIATTEAYVTVSITPLGRRYSAESLIAESRLTLGYPALGTPSRVANLIALGVLLQAARALSTAEE